jgi:redox-sensitive bicupin YhaK (pirin superfamily)
VITIYRADERHHAHGRAHDHWRTFHRRGPGDPLAAGFGVLAALDEDRLGPGERHPRQPTVDGELVTYVRAGALAVLDARGASGTIHAGEFRRTIAHPDLRHGVGNASRTDWVHAFQLSLAAPGLPSGLRADQRGFAIAEHGGRLCVVASPDGRSGSLRLHADVVILAAALAPGQLVAHALAPGRAAWIHVVAGDATLGDFSLTAGDGVGVTNERTVTLRAHTATELLLCDLIEPPPLRPRTRSRPRSLAG